MYNIRTTVRFEILNQHQSSCLRDLGGPSITDPLTTRGWLPMTIGSVRSCYKESERSLLVMQQSRSSRTAMYMTLFRALENARPADERLFADPYAKRWLPSVFKAVVLISQVPLFGHLIVAVLDTRWPKTRSSAVVRTRLIDEHIERALAAGCVQVVLLGAGFDSRAFRLRTLKAAEVFEVDHPATQAAKLAAVEDEAKLSERSLRYVPVDFETDSLESSLVAAGFDCRRPAVFLWEGVVSYLSERAVGETFSALSRLCTASSEIVFTYVDKRALNGSTVFPEAAAWITKVQSDGEPFTFGFLPAELPNYARAHGFLCVSDESTADAAGRYAFKAGRTEQGSQLYRVAVLSRTGGDADA